MYSRTGNIEEKVILKTRTPIESHKLVGGSMRKDSQKYGTIETVTQVGECEYEVTYRRVVFIELGEENWENNYISLFH